VERVDRPNKGGCAKEIIALRKQRIVPGRLAPAYEAELGRLRANQVIARLWARETSLWKAGGAHAETIANRLGWLSAVEAMRAEAHDLIAFGNEMAALGLHDLVLLGMGGSSLAPEVFSLLFPAPADGRRFFVLDTTDPESIRAVEHSVDPARTLFIVASKSGRTIETLSQFACFRSQLNQAGVARPGGHFIAITDAGSPLDQLAQEHGFRRIFRNPADIGGRYSALSYFGLVPAALWGADVNKVLDAAAEMEAACGPQAPVESNPALRLGALLGAAALSGRDKLFLLSPRGLEPLGNWIEQLVAESTGKDGRGIVPVVGGAAPAEAFADECVAVALTIADHHDATLRDTMEALRQAGVPVAEIDMAEPADLGAEYFRWEVATVLAGISLSIDPFDEPNVQESKDATASLLRSFETTGAMPQGSLLLAESGIELYGEAGTPHPVSGLRVAEVLRAFLSRRRPGDYLALLAYVVRDAANAAELEALRIRLAERLGMPVLLGYGPRYLHSIGQLYKGGPASGMFVVMTSQKAEDFPIPGAPYTFAQLQLAQALGDLQRLALRGRPAVRLHLAQGAQAGLAAVRAIVEDALAASHPAVP
jgi:glucose-6-phosphate isomerase/transaldolase/glucose-6-phosphate isomerase